MSILSGIASAASSLLKTILPTAAKVEIAGTTVTASQLETSVGTLSTYLTQIHAAIIEKNYASGAELTIEEALTIATDLGIGQPYVGIARILFPIIFDKAEEIVLTPLIPVNGGMGGFVTNDWSKDPRHQLNPDGTFKY